MDLAQDRVHWWGLVLLVFDSSGSVLCCIVSTSALSTGRSLRIAATGHITYRFPLASP
jgi:hypothetical protein